MAEKLKYHAFKRNTLLEELQTILHEYPDNEQIIKELLQNAEDAGARVVKMGFCPSSTSEHLPDPYKKYLSGPAFCFYNDSAFEEKDWEGITMVRKSIKHDDPMKVGKFGIGFKSVFHITDTVVVISGTSILFIDPLYEEIDPKKVCCKVSILDFVQQDVCGQQGLEPLYSLFGINEDIITEGYFAGTVFWFPLRNSPSNLSENVYSPQKVLELLASFKKEIGSEMLFLTSIEKIGLFRMVNSSWEADTVVSLDDSCAKGIREERKRYKTEIKSIEDHMERDDQWISHCDPVWMKCTFTYNVVTNGETSRQEWIVINYFHAGTMSAEISNLIRNRRSKYRPYIGIAARLDQPISCGQIFCFLPLPFQDESSTGLPVHVNGFFSLDSSRQHIKWPSHDETSSKSHLENDMLWNVCLVHKILPIVYKELFEFWRSNSKSTQRDLNIFYHCIPRITEIKLHWACVGKEINDYLLESRIPCTEKKTWVQMREAYFAIFKEDIQQDVRDSVLTIFLKCGYKVVSLGEHEDLFQQWNYLANLNCTTPLKTRNLLKMKDEYKELQRSSKEHILLYCCSDGKLSDLDEIELLPLQNKRYHSFQQKQGGGQETVYLCEKEELEILIGKEGSLVLKDSTKFGQLLEKLAISGYYAFQNMRLSTLLQFLREIVKKAEMNIEKPMLLRHSSAVFGDIWLAKVWRYLTNLEHISLEQVQELYLVKTKESDELKKVSDSFICETGIEDCRIKTLAYFNIWVLDTTFQDNPLLKPGRGIVQEFTNEGKSKVLERRITNGLDLFNNQSTATEKEWFKEFLPDSIQKSLILSLRRLNIFKCFSSVNTVCFEYTSLDQCDRVYIGTRDFPIQFPKKIIMSTNGLEERLLLELNASKFDLTDCVQSWLEENGERLLKATDEDKRKFCFYVLGKKSELRNWEKIQTLLNEIKFIKNGTKQLCSANELYEPNDLVLKELFLDESRFPEEHRKEMSLLCTLTFRKCQSQEFLLDIFHTCQNFEKNTTVLKGKKSNALLQILRHNPQIVEKIYTCKVVPFQEERNTNYPKSMNWYTNPEKFVSFKMMYSSQYIFIIGSVRPTPTTEWEEFIGSTQPELSDVIKHFHKTVMCYDEDEHTGYSFMMEKVYQYLAKEKQSDFVKLLPANCVLTENGFLPASKIYIERNKSDIDLKPYFIPLPKEYIAMKDMFEKFGCKKSQSSYLLVESLNEIEKSQLEKNTQSDSKEDLIRAEKILKKLSELSKEEISDIKNKIKVPIESKTSDKLEFKFAKECAYSDSDWFSRTFAEEDNVCLIHSEIDNVIAEKIGVKSLKKFTLSDVEEICSEFGQSEPLTQRLNRLLEEGYTDGLSVPKELIQNADDAGASEVYFLYDERENEDAKSCLLDSRMEECQGPALWAFNNAVFTSSDFENIQKLSGASKKQDTTKIGKFGLGFNAVYNLTDVPSFVSGTYLVYLDPHGKYLGDAIVNERSPGIRLNLKNGVMLSKLKNQFKPYQNVFGFSSSIFAENKTFEGTLFRFPLRTKHQARTSEISNKEYSPKEMEKLMKQFCNNCGNMILFTQNVTQIKIFHADGICINPEKEMKLVLTVKKDSQGQAMNKCQNNILMAASQHCNANVQTSKFHATVNMKIRLSSEGHAWIERTSKFAEETNWILSWALGNNKALKLFQEKKSDGALPLSSVGIPFDTMNGRLSPVCLGTRKPVFNKYGFYDTSHVFCFLPLPIKSTLAFHVNGTFAICSDRQRLLTGTEDDKEYRKQSLWNDSLLSDATLEAILELLIEIKNSSAENLMYTGYELWPIFDGDVLWRTLQIEFYKAVVERMLPVFKTHKGYKSFQKCIFLHLDIKSDKHLNKFAFDILKENELDNKIIADIPDEIYKGLEIVHGIYFLEHVVSYEKFIIESFLPNIAEYPGVDYDKIVLGALRSGNKKILMALDDSNCITTCSDGLRKSPKHLVHPDCSISGIFLTKDRRFPIDLFCEEKDLDVLVSLGMMKNDVPFDILIAQTKDVEKISTNCTECAFLRSKSILCYIHCEVQKEDKYQQLSDIPFLPVKEKPDNWPPIQWNIEIATTKNEKCPAHKDVQNSYRFKHPSNLFFPSILNLVGCSKFLLGRYDELSPYKDELQLLGVKGEKDIDLGTLKIQVSEMTKNPKNAKIKQIEEMCSEIYSTLSRRLSDLNIEDFVCNELPKIPCILTDETFVYPKQVIFSLMHDCSPYLYGLRPRCVEYFTPLMKKIGVRKSFDSSDIKDALLQIKKENDEKPLSAETLGLVCRLTTLFDDSQSIPFDDLYLPDTNRIFCHVKDLCIDDLDWISTTESMRVLNATISRKVAEMAGIKSKRVQSILNDSEDFGEEFGQHEDLTSRIKRILDGYPQTCILRELLQNADDAGATELHFIKDFRYHGTKHILSDNWKELQGPALCVYNDSVFSEKDLKGIQNLGIGSKGEDPTSTGQYGVGFNVVYHLTDAPSFLTRDLKNNLDTYCVLDPQQRYISCASLKLTGRKFPNASEIVRKKFTDIRPCFLENSNIWQSCRGTLFRFPLRCYADSLLSHKITTCEAVNDMLDMLKNEIAECLIFLHNVRKISISSVKKDGSLENEFTVTAETSNKSDEADLHILARNVEENLKQNTSYTCEVERKEMKYILNIRINNESTQEWLVVTAFGFMNKSSIPLQIQNAYAESRLALLPISGIAFNLKNERLTRNKEGKNANEELKDFRAYCFLPLPLHTGLPVHVNGHFALDHEARQNIWWPEEEDLKVCWNRCLIENVIVPTYVSCLHHLKKILFTPGVLTHPQSHLNVFYNAFPCMENIRTKVWQHTAKTFYNSIIESNCCVFPIVSKEYEHLEMTPAKQEKKDSEKTQKGKAKTTEAIKLTSEAEQLDIQWVPLRSGDFPAYFDDIKTQLENYFGQGSMKWASQKSEFLSSVLKDLGMKIIDSPMQIFHSMKEAGTNVQTVSPKNVLHFLKSYRSEKVDKCNIGQVNVDVSQTRFQRINSVCHILDYCLKDKELTAIKFQNVPLLLSEAKTIHEFEEKNQIFLTPIKHLLPLSANKIVHSRQYDMLHTSNVLRTFVKNLRIQDLAILIVDNVPEKYSRGTVEYWEKKSPHLPNDEWIKRFWLFLCTHLRILKKEFDDQKAVENKTMKKNKEQYHEKSPIEDLFCSLLKYLGLCSFLPVSVNGEDKLYPLKDGKQVFKLLAKTDRPEQVALIQMNVPVLDEQSLLNVKKGQHLDQNHISEITEYLVATLESAIDTLNCVYENRMTLNLKKSACEIMLEFFVRHIDIFEKNPSCKEKLRNLPLYCGLDNKLMALSKNEIIVLPEEMPQGGLHTFGLRITKVFIRQNRVPSEFFAYLGCITMTTTELYIHYILPHFNQVPSTAVMQHVMFIKNDIFPQLLYKKNEKNGLWEELYRLLKGIAFIPVGDVRLTRACEFYNPHEEIFMTENQLCSPTELPPYPFNEIDWEQFLVYCGMKNCMTTDIFLDFASRLESLANDHGITCVVKENSKRMVKILFSDRMLSRNFSFQRIQDAKFLTPLEIHNDLLIIAPQRERKSRLLCFHDTTLPSNKLLVWTVMDAISNDLSNIMSRVNISVAVGKCGFLEEPHQETVINHTVNVCNGLEKNIKKICSEKPEVEGIVKRMMTQIYTFLQKNLNNENVCCLKNIPFIFISERKSFVRPEQVVLGINKDEEIPPYLFKTSSEFGQFHSLFEKNGAAQSLTCTLIANVLFEIWNKSKGNILEPNIRSCTNKAVKILFSKLKTEDAIDFNVSVLYLPGKNSSLIQSSALIFIDDRLLEDRIGNNMPDMDYFVGFKDLGMKVYDPVSEICRLPEKHRPHLLSRVVIEQLDSDCKQNIKPSTYAQHLQALIHCEHFLGGVCRLIRDEQYKKDCFSEEEVEIEIGKKLQLVEVKCIEQLTTVMTYKNKILPNTSKRKVMFSVEESNDTKVAKLCIYFEATGNPDDSTWLKNFTKQVAITLNVYLGKPLRENNIHLPDLLKCILSPMSIERELDNLGICKIDEKNLSKERFIPVLGTEISIDLLRNLKNDCTNIYPEEYVAYEQFSPMDNKSNVKETEPIYILAKVLNINYQRHVNLNADELPISYLIEFGSEQPIEVVASKVYKFN